MSSFDPPSPLEDHPWPPALLARAQKPRSHSLETEGVRTLQVKFAAIMHRRKERRRASQPPERGAAAESPSRTPIAKKFFTSIIGGDSGARRGSVDAEVSPPIVVDSWEDGRRSVPRGIPILARPLRGYSEGSSPSSPLVQLLPQRRVLPPRGEEREGPPFGLPPGTRKCTLSGGAGGAFTPGFYGDYLRNNLMLGGGGESPRADSILGDDDDEESASDSATSGTGTGSSDENRSLSDIDDDDEFDGDHVSTKKDDGFVAKPLIFVVCGQRILWFERNF